MRDRSSLSLSALTMPIVSDILGFVLWRNQVPEEKGLMATGIWGCLKEKTKSVSNHFMYSPPVKSDNNDSTHTHACTRVRIHTYTLQSAFYYFSSIQTESRIRRYLEKVYNRKHKNQKEQR